MLSFIKLAVVDSNEGYTSGWLYSMHTSLPNTCCSSFLARSLVTDHTVFVPVLPLQSESVNKIEAAVRLRNGKTCCQTCCC